MAKGDKEQAVDSPVEQVSENDAPTSPAEQALVLVRQAIEALAESRSVKYADEFGFIGGKLEWLAGELEQRL